MGKTELVALLNLSFWCPVMVERLFLVVPQGCLRYVIAVFPDHTHLLFLILYSILISRLHGLIRVCILDSFVLEVAIPFNVEYIKEALAKFLKFKGNDHECRNLFIITLLIRNLAFLSKYVFNRNQILLQMWLMLFIVHLWINYLIRITLIKSLYYTNSALPRTTFYDSCGVSITIIIS